MEEGHSPGGGGARALAQGRRRVGRRKGDARTRCESLHARDHERAERLLEEARAEYRRVGDERRATEALLWLGMAVHGRGGASRAALVREALVANRRLCDRRLFTIGADTVLWLVGDRADPESLARLMGTNEALRQVIGFARDAWERTLFAPAAGLKTRLDAERVAAARTEAYALVYRRNRASGAA